ncbi:hypothetical protein [Falsiroseomonas stagni]|uniref:Uncharacterized protein n=1 Tax=Falsiroseomonas stagni DSM 19981 TaxID=1123062 RepID=A0A1I3Z836_9PROT|nr:hypothetical protein [Falsiroseomonas stagni]SFK40268.1 hypothetical protein SAMN02745775_102277 [Falsiroseomonas stagni DSM 19981]
MRALILAAVLAPGLAFAQSAPLTGPNAAAVHGQAPAGRQSLTSPAAGQAPRTAPAQPQRQAAARPRTRNTSPLGTVNPRTATGPAGGRTSASELRHEAQVNEAQRRQREATRRAVEAQDGVRLGR